ncbi:MAG TPA: amino acid permease [Candidatus Brocadiia bacterium]|nr:amino acid permease [Candidatus Brocadiia bacterium]
MIAVFYYIAQAVAVSMYVIGFTEAVFSAFPALELSFQMVATLTNILVFACVYIGAGWTIKIQYVILAVLMLSVGSFWVGGLMNASMDTLSSNMEPQWTAEYGFFGVFALFFPAVTGIMAGVNMSGDLRNPSRSIPKGTLMAIGLTALIYASFAVILAACNSREALLGHSFVVKDTAWSGLLIYAGVICATLSSALGSMMGAPRILQAFARDNIFPWLKGFGRGSGVSDEPRRAIVITFMISQIGIMIGDLDTVAPIITMFFLITYGTINLACFDEMISRNPSFRPTFRFNHWSLALAGALGCLAVMFLINWVWAIAAILLAGGTYALIARAEIIVQWGDVQSGLAFQRARKALLRLEQESYHAKNWRPSTLALSGGAWNRLNLVKYACLLSADRGTVSLAQIIIGNLDDRIALQHEAERQMRKFISEERLAAFPVVVADESFLQALKALLQCHGIGGLRPNILLLGWSGDPSSSTVFTSILSLAKRMNRSLIVIRRHKLGVDLDDPVGLINIWWNDSKNAQLMLLMGFLLRENRAWRGCPLRILRTVPPLADVDNVLKEMNKTLSSARIFADVVVLPTDDPLEAVRRAMQPSAVLFVGFEPGETDPGGILAADLQDIMGLPGDVILVYNAGDVSLTA